MTYHRRPPFKPSTRGDLSEALKTKDSLPAIAPESPRPAEMLTGVQVQGDVNLTGFDLALHELLVSRAYETDTAMAQESYAMPLREVLNFLGENARRDMVFGSLRKMRNVMLSFTAGTRQYADVPMIVSWQEIQGDVTSIGFEFPTPIRTLMRNMPAYGYIELVPISQGRMASKYSQTLYKHFVAELSRERWQDGGDNLRTIMMTPDQLADVTSFPRFKGRVVFGKLTERVLRHLIADLSAVKRFELLAYDFDGKPEPVRGKAVETVNFHFRLSAPSHHLVYANDRHIHKAGARIGAPDEEKYRVNSNVWLKAAQTFRSLYMSHVIAFYAWQVALQEALDGRPLSEAGGVRRFRGKGLLTAIDANGADAAAYAFFGEEADLGADLVYSDHVRNHLPSAEKARLERIGATKRKRGRPPGNGKATAPKVISSKPQEKPSAAVASIPEPEDVTFENCTHIEVTLDPACTQKFLEDEVYAVMDRRTWCGRKPRTFRVRYHIGGGMLDRLDIGVTPEDEADLHDGLNKIAKWVDGPITYARITA